MTSIELTEKQRKEIALSWILEQNLKEQGYEEVINHLFNRRSFTRWTYDEALRYAVGHCVRQYTLPGVGYVLKELKCSSKPAN